MFNENCLLSILIPTKNRQDYCFSILKSLLSYDRNFELVIHDNSDDEKLKKLIEREISDSRLKYFYTSEKISSIENFNQVVSKSTSEYICMIGDDDGVNPIIFDVVKILKQKNINSLTGSIKANYRWSGIDTPDTMFTDLSGATLTIEPFNKNIKKINSDKQLKRLLKNGATNYLLYDFPKLYHGIVKKSIIEDVKKLTGNYIGGLSPDIYSVIAISSLVKEFYITEYPLTVPGVCSDSTSVSEGEQNDDVKSIHTAFHLNNRGPYTIDKNVPPVYCPQVIWADSALHAFNDMNHKNYGLVYNKNALCAQIFVLNIKFAKYVLKHIKLNSNGIFNMLFNYASLTYFLIFGKKAIQIYTKILNRILVLLRIRKLCIYNDVDNIGSAMTLINSKYKKINDSFLCDLKRINDVK